MDQFGSVQDSISSAQSDKSVKDARPVFIIEYIVLTERSSFRLKSGYIHTSQHCNVLIFGWEK